MSVQDDIHKILWDRRYVVIPDGIDKPEDLDYVIVRDMTVEDRNFYSFIKAREKSSAIKNGVPSEEEIMKAARESEYWTEQDDEVLEKADDHIAFLESEFEAKKKFRSRQNIIKLQIADALAKKEHVNQKKNQLLSSSADYYAHEVACILMIQRLILRADGSKLFPDDSSILLFKHDYPLLLYFLINEVMSEGVFDLAVIRKIARSIEWRMIWTLNRENLSGIFDRPISGITLNQKLLIYWSRIYDSAIESMEPPEADIIEDDTKFDQWLADRDIKKDEDEKTEHSRVNLHQERGQVLDGEYVEDCTCGAKETNKKKYLGERVPHANTCLFGTWRAYTPEEKERIANRVYGRNPERIRKLINKQQEAVERTGVIEEQRLRDKKSREVMGLTTKVIPIHRR